MPPPLISVIVPCYKQAQFLPEALACVQAQTYQDWECIIVNDGSPDNTAQVAQEWVARDSRFRYIEKPNGGLSSARNAGIDAANGEFILPLDADDKIADTYLEKGLGYLDLYGNNHVVSCYVQAFGSADYLWKPMGVGIEYFVTNNEIVCTSIFSKTLWKTLNGYDEEMRQGFEDWDFWLRAADAGAVFTIIPEPLFKYRRHEYSMIHEAYSRRYAILKYLVHKNGDIFQKHYVAAIMGREYEIAQLKNQIQSNIEQTQLLLQSKDYILGHLLLRPLRWIKRRLVT